MSHYNKFALTTGDKNGIGFEVTAKALAEVALEKNKHKTLYFLFRHSEQEKTQPQYFKLLDKHWMRLTFFSLEDALGFVNTANKAIPQNTLIDLSLKTSEADWVLQATHACRLKNLDALVTGPLSKKKTSALPIKALGHTGIFRHVFPKNSLFMSFIGQDFNVLLATDHVPLGRVEKKLTRSSLKPVLKAAKELKSLLKSKKNFALLGFNPHSGEDGLIGKTESQLFKRLPKDAEGPLVPDAAFLKKNWNKYCFFVCLYHDQGLIPFKMHHGQDSGVHLTLGLPFIRTSVDHGTAFDLFNKNIANHHSMLESIKLANQLIGVKNV